MRKQTQRTRHQTSYPARRASSVALREETTVAAANRVHVHTPSPKAEEARSKAPQGCNDIDGSLKRFLTGPSGASWCLALHGDAFDLLDALPEGSVDLFITSPPYWGLRTYGLPHRWDIDKEWKALGNTIHDCPPYDWYRGHGGILGLESMPEWYVSHLAEILHKCWRSLKASGSLWINIGDTYFARWSSIRPEGRQGLGGPERFRRKTPMGGFRQEKNLLLIPSRVAIALQEQRWILRNDLIWFKPNVPPRPDTDRLRLAHEHFFHFVKRPSEGRAKYYYDKAATEPGDVDVVTCNVRAGENGHTATFPSELIRPRIVSSSPEGGIVVDPFCGSGRVLTESVSLGRRAIGFDLCQEYAAASAESARTAQPELSYAELH